MKRFAAVMAGILLMGSSCASASEPVADGAPVPASQQEPAASSLPEMSVSDNGKESACRPYEIQMEYLEGRFYKARQIDRYNVHLFERIRNRGSVSLYRGLSVARMTGYNTEDGIWRDSEAWGIGPSLMIRWEKPMTGKLSGALEASGTLEVYHHAHPAGGRAFGFLWRVGPRLKYQFTEQEALSVGYIFHHSSNGFGSHNPGYNGIGFSLGYHRSF